MRKNTLQIACFVAVIALPLVSRIANAITLASDSASDPAYAPKRTAPGKASTRAMTSSAKTFRAPITAALASASGVSAEAPMTVQDRTA
jgi:hypothetical protein